MPGLAITALVLVLIAAVIGGSLAVGAPVFAIPIVFAILVVWGGARLTTRREQPGIGEEDVPDEEIEFDDRDKRTLTTRAATPPGRRP
jgi:uncharacterized membrane protein